MVGDERAELSGEPDAGAAALPPDPRSGEGVAPRHRLHARHRILLLVVIAGVVFVTAHATGLDRSLTPEHIRALLAGAGVFGVVVFVIVFSLGPMLRMVRDFQLSAQRHPHTAPGQSD